MSLKDFWKFIDDYLDGRIGGSPPQKSRPTPHVDPPRFHFWLCYQAGWNWGSKQRNVQRLLSKYTPGQRIEAACKYATYLVDYLTNGVQARDLHNVVCIYECLKSVMDVGEPHPAGATEHGWHKAILKLYSDSIPYGIIGSDSDGNG